MEQDGSLVDVIIHDQRAILTVCTPTPEVAGVPNVTVSLPHLVGGEGILTTLPLSLNGEEKAALRASAQVIRDVTDALKVKDGTIPIQGGTPNEEHTLPEHSEYSPALYPSP